MPYYNYLCGISDTFSVKKLYILILRSYAGPAIATFFISVFVLLMQFLWRYVDDLVGKGLEWNIILQLLFYASFTFVPMALPLSILLSSLMTFGSLGERYELVAIKAACGCGVGEIVAVDPQLHRRAVRVGQTRSGEKHAAGHL